MNVPAAMEFLKNPWLALERTLNETLSPGMALLDMNTGLRKKSSGPGGKEDAAAGLHENASAS